MNKQIKNSMIGSSCGQNNTKETMMHKLKICDNYMNDQKHHRIIIAHAKTGSKRKMATNVSHCWGRTLCRGPSVP